MCMIVLNNNNDDDDDNDVHTEFLPHASGFSPHSITRRLEASAPGSWTQTGLSSLGLQVHEPGMQSACLLTQQGHRICRGGWVPHTPGLGIHARGLAEVRLSFLKADSSLLSRNKEA